MKQILRFIIFLSLTLIAGTSQSQVTQLSDNTNIVFGIALANTGILSDKDGNLWKTDGTQGGTIIYTSKVHYDTLESGAVLNNKLYFRGIGSTGEELWVTDGTDAGTTLVKDIESGATSSSPTNLIVFNNELYFFATTTASGKELWKSDGTLGGTVMVKDINPGSSGSYDASNTRFFISNNILYFDAINGTNGTELWKTNGTSGGTVMIKDINAGAGSSNCTEFTTLGNIVFFNADDGLHGTELWKTDGTNSGTVLVKDIVSGVQGSVPNSFVAFNNTQMFFIAFSAIQNFQLWITDGSSGGTTLLKDFGFFPAVLYTSIIINNKLFFTATDLTNGYELWSTDGTPAGTSLFKDINVGTGSSIPIILPDFLSFQNFNSNYHTKLFNGKIFFIADDGTHGEELWITDGTTANTQIVKDLNPGSGSSIGTGNLSWFYTSTNFYFAADNGTTGNELFVTDGTGANTSLVQDINPGSGSSNPFMFMFFNSHIYLTADDGNNGSGNTDLYKIDAAVVLPVKLVNFTASTDGKVVGLSWSTATENNAKDFVVQRSIDANRFENIGTVNAKGNSTAKTDYHFTDGGALSTGASKLYYRLQMVDKDGKFVNSIVASVNITSNNKVFVVYPNPVKDKLVIVANTVGSALIKITDQSGKTVLTQQFENIQSGDKNTINVAALGSGVYFLQIISNNNKQTTRFVKY